MTKQIVKIKPLNENLCCQISGNQVPFSLHEGDSGFDLRAWIEEPVELAFSETKLIPTGIALEMPPGLEAQIRPRSGLALKHGLTVLNSPATIDNSYRGEVGVLLTNFGERPFVVSPGMRIAQLVFAQVLPVELKVTYNLSETKRDQGGFGSTGLS